MSLRLTIFCLAILLMVLAPLPTPAAPLEASLVEGSIVPEVDPIPPTPASEVGKPKQRTFFLLLPLLFPDQYY